MNLLLDGILRQIDGTQPLDYNTSKKHVNLDLPIQFSDQYGNLSSVRNNNICMIILSKGKLEYPNDLQLSKSYSILWLLN